MGFGFYVLFCLSISVSLFFGFFVCFFFRKWKNGHELGWGWKNLGEFGVKNMIQIYCIESNLKIKRFLSLASLTMVFPVLFNCNLHFFLWTSSLGIKINWNHPFCFCWFGALWGCVIGPLANTLPWATLQSLILLYQTLHTYFFLLDLVKLTGTLFHFHLFQDFS